MNLSGTQSNLPWLAWLFSCLGLLAPKKSALAQAFSDLLSLRQTLLAFWLTLCLALTTSLTLCLGQTKAWAAKASYRSRLAAVQDEACEKMLQSILSEDLSKKINVKPRENSRKQSVRQAAKVYGFQKAFQWKYQGLLSELEQHAMDLNKIFDFRRLLIEGRILPPVIKAMGPALQIVSDNLATYLEKEYTIVRQAKIVGPPPTYLTYLWHETLVKEPNPQLLPRDSLERQIWQEGLTEGFHEGVAHAFFSFDLAWESLVNDYRGMLLFLKLKQEGLVYGPILSKGELGVKVGEEVLTMEQQIFRLSQGATFKKKEAQADVGRK